MTRLLPLLARLGTVATLMVAVGAWAVTPAGATPVAGAGPAAQALGPDGLFPHINAPERSVCARAARAEEQARGIPTGLLGAIALAESGRWDAANGENFAWPWTVTARGKGHFLPDRPSAIGLVRDLQAQGVRNIDVGCLQINLLYHPDAFATLEEAFDPAANAAYSAAFLTSRFEITRSWIGAAGAYHSTTANLNRKYRAKINRLWRETAGAPEPQTDEATVANKPAPDAAITTLNPVADSMLMARLNDGFRTRAAPTAPDSNTKTVTPVGQYDPNHALRNRLSKWRKTQTQDLGKRHTRNVNQVLQSQARLGLLANDDARTARFAAARQAQLMAWRETTLGQR